VEIVKENNGELSAILKCTLHKDDYAPKVEDALKKYTKKIDLKGFRKGQVPVGVVKKMYGNAILAEEVNNILQDALYKYLEDEKIQILGQPMPQDGQHVVFEINDLQDYQFNYEIGISPDADLSYMSKLPAYEQYAIEIDEKMLDEEVDGMRVRYGKRTSPDEVQGEDIIYVEFKELNEDGSPKEGGWENSTSFNVNMIIAGPTKEEVLAMKKGDSVNLNVFESFDKDRESVGKYMLNAKDEELAAIGNMFKMTLSNISRQEKAELNEEFFSALYADGSVTTEAEMRNKIKEDLTKYFSAQTEKKVIQQLGKDLIENAHLSFPDAFLKRWIKASNEKPVTDEELEKDYPGFTKELTWNIIVGKVAKENELKVEYAEILQRTREIVQNQLLQYGMGYMPDEQLDNFGKRFLEDKRHIQRTHETLLEEKVLYRLKQDINIVEKPISLDAYNELMKSEAAAHDHDHEHHDHDHEHEHEHQH